VNDERAESGHRSNATSNRVREGCAEAIRVVPLAPGAALNVRLDPTPPPEPDALLSLGWEHMRVKNPRLFNAPMLALCATELTPTATTLCVRVETYQRFAAQGMVGIVPPIEQLSVTAVLVARDAQGTQHVLMGKRGPGVRVYADQWELGPSGGVDAPEFTLGAAASTPPIDAAYLHAQLRGEIAEELDRDVRLTRATPIALVHDDFAFSCDVVYLAEVAGPPWSTPDVANWEYAGTRWLRTADVSAFCRQHEDIIPPTRAIVQMLGWA